jgi:hypothetical protein
MTSRLHSLLRRVCTDDLWHSIVHPTLADLQHEEQCASSRVRALLAFVAACWGLFKAVSIYGLTLMARDSRQALPSLAIRFLVALFTITFLLAAPYYFSARRIPVVAHALLIPATLTAALPVAVFLAVLLHASARRDCGIHLLRAVLPLALATAVAALVMWMWIVPSSNQAFRVFVYNSLSGQSISSNQLPGGWNERSWTELRSIAADPTHAQAGQARGALRRRYVWSAVTFFAGLIAIPFGLILGRLRGNSRN